MNPQLIRKEDLHTDHRRTVPSRPATMAESLGPPATRSFLTSTHWKLLSNVVHAFDTYTSVLHGLDDSLALVTPISTSLQSFIRSIADFRIMTSGEQSSLLQRNMQGPLTYYCLVVFAECGLFDNGTNDHVQRMKSISRRLDPDPISVKLFLMTLTFSSDIYEQNRTYRALIERSDLVYDDHDAPPLWGKQCS